MSKNSIVAYFFVVKGRALSFHQKVIKSVTELEQKTPPEENWMFFLCERNFLLMCRQKDTVCPMSIKKAARAYLNGEDIPLDPLPRTDRLKKLSQLIKIYV